MLDKTTQAHADTGETGPCIGELPDFYKATRYTVEELALGLRVLTAKTRDMNDAHVKRQAVALKCAAEGIVKVANEMHVMAGHLARVATEHVNRKAKS